MNFDKSRVYTTLNAEELEVGSKVIVADNLSVLKEDISNLRLLKVIERIEPEVYEHRFLCDDSFSYALAYLIEEPEENKLKWTDLKISDVITNGKSIAMVTEIDKDCADGFPILAGHKWLNDTELAEWEKVEE